MYTTEGSHQMLNALAGFYLAVHDAFPTDNGSAGECSGGSPAYARKLGTFASASGKQRVLSSSVTFDIPTGFTVRWVTRWSAVSGGSCYQIGPNGGELKKYQVDASADLVRLPAHGYTNGTIVVFIGGTAPGNLTEGTLYYVINATTDTFQVSTTLGGSVRDITSQAGAGSQCSKLVEQTYGAQGTFVLPTFTIQQR